MENKFSIDHEGHTVENDQHRGYYCNILKVFFSAKARARNLLAMEETQDFKVLQY